MQQAKQGGMLYNSKVLQLCKHSPKLEKMCLRASVSDYQRYITGFHIPLRGIHNLKVPPSSQRAFYFVAHLKKYIQKSYTPTEDYMPSA